MKLPRDWLKELELLAWKFAAMGFGSDLAGMTVTELAALYMHLARLASASGAR